MWTHETSRPAARLSWRTSWLLRVAALAAVLASVSGCVVVQPWQRGRLAERHMQIPPNQGEAYLDQHVATSKESASGGATLEGGGCGCN